MVEENGEVREEAKRTRAARSSSERVTAYVNDSSVGDLARFMIAGGFSFPFGASRAGRPVHGEGCTACQIEIRLNLIGQMAY